MKLIYVEWWDHSSFANNGWQDLEDLEDLKDLDPMLFTSVGHLIKETPTFILVAGCLGEEEGKYAPMGKHVTCILKCAIKKRRNIRM